MTTSAFARFLATRSSTTLSIAPGIDTPLSFGDASREHLATRRAAGLFDFSFMGCVEITGAGSRPFLEALQTRSIAALARGRIAYTLLLRDDASVLIDATVWHLDTDRYWLFVGRRGDIDYISDAARGYAVTLADKSRQHAVIAVQGGASRSIIARALGLQPALILPYFGFSQLGFAGADCWLARIGYSGETGYELVIDDAAAPALWEALRAAGGGDGLIECGFAATDTLRIEAGHILFTHELAAPATPAELGMTRLVDTYRTNFCGARAWRALHGRVPERRLVGLLPSQSVPVDAAPPALPAAGSAVVTSACTSPLFERELALGFVLAADAWPGSVVRLACGVRAQVTRLPFYDPARRLARRAC